MGGTGLRIREFQDMMRRIYFHRDTERGVNGTYRWLLDEVRELGGAIRGRKKEAIEDECADVMAWLASLTNLLRVDLEACAMTKYDNKCPKCQKTPCKCPF